MQYSCPMHPEIVRDEPGDCPICGMALEPKGLPDLLGLQHPATPLVPLGLALLLDLEGLEFLVLTCPRHIATHLQFPRLLGLTP